MKMGKAPQILKKAAAMCKSKTAVVAARILVLASLRRRMATVGAISHRIHALMVPGRPEKSAVYFHKVLLPPSKVVENKPSIHGCNMVVDLSHELASFDNQEDGHVDWTLHPIFNDDDGGCCYTDEYEGNDSDDDDGDVAVLGELDNGDEPSVMDVIRRNREVEGLEFNMEDEIDQAADMFIRRFRERMNQSFY
ncbi:uncharacterized protein LOC100823418 [Brachypodium distachyon]|uniref:Uncharacterized protein n=1 Tax=Brachypodium distachyon TaxID=15368 RepID=I1IRP9_BRADI|nr:uncharacterized protein LOC100823418 [Brachypodium distachyon]KQJ90971.1 hypothetical protein BRADI_4g34910v3 [Brachypodium distachyon]|eukprot:XP_003578411.1 uncharacterized protein LOC100823418 [Brachypodium distachyon]